MNKGLSFIFTLILALFCLSVLAQDFNLDSLDSDSSFKQINSVSQLQDVEPTDWAYEALRSLVERYGCIVGYPDRSYRGNRALSRYEFAAGLNACMQQMERLITQNEAVLREDIEILKRLAKEFEYELAMLGARIDNLEGRVAYLEDNSFSTTTKLTGEVIMAVTGADNSQVTFGNRIRLNLNTSFTGSDLLKVRLQASNLEPLSRTTGTDMARLSFDGSSNNDVQLNEVYYRTNISFADQKLTLWLGAAGLDLDDINEVNTFSYSGTGSLSRFNRYNPLVIRGNDGTGLGLKYAFDETFNIVAFYLTNPVQGSNPDFGIFNSNFSTGVQFNIKPVETVNLNLNYIHSYYEKGLVNLTGSTGSAIGKDPFDGEAAATLDAVGLNVGWKITDQLELGGWVGYGYSTAQGINSNAELWTWNTHLSIFDFGKEGAVLSLAGGLPPKVGYVKDFPSDKGTSYLVEASYQYPVTDNISITPGAYVVLNPNHDNDNNTVWVASIRTTFKF